MSEQRPHSIPPEGSSHDERIEALEAQAKLLKLKLDVDAERFEERIIALEEHVNKIEGRIPTGLEGTAQELERRVGNVEDDVARKADR